jgi:alkylhydroperoxidase/carboxymuconolactone decarboxylase family protein YurZ
MNALPKPPETFTTFVERYPELGEAWELMATGGRQGPLDEATARLIKLGIAIGAMREGAVHASVRKALAAGVEPAALEQVVALPGAVAAFSWVRDLLSDPAD